MDKLEFSMDQLSLIAGESAKLGVESGQEMLRASIAEYFDQLAAKDCFKPNFTQIAADIRSGVIGGYVAPDLSLVDLTDEKVRDAYRLGQANMHVEIRNAIARENLRCQTMLKLVQKQWQKVGLGVRASFIDELRDVIAPVQHD